MNGICPIKSYIINTANYTLPKSHMRVQFKGTPKKMDLSSYYINNYDNLKNGSYLDIHDDAFAPQNKEIRQHNLSFLDKLNKWEKADFVDYYCNLTNFPDLKKVSEKIETEFINSIQNVSSSFNEDEYKCIAAGYDTTCSVGKKMAFPGSDLDKAFILIKGSSDLKKDKTIVEKFKSALWNCTDQRILSFNHDTSFPTIYTIAQMNYLINVIDMNTRDLSFDKNHLKNIIENEYVDIDKAAEYNIEISKKFKEPSYSERTTNANKEDVKNFAFFIESLRDGKLLIETSELKNIKRYLAEYDFYNFSNVAQLKAMQNAVNSGKEQKNKIIKRKSLMNDFKNWDTDKKFNFIKTLIKYSCEDADEFSEYFKNDRDIKSKYKHLLSTLTKEDEKYFYNPIFYIKPESAAIQLGENIYVDLYQGYSPNVLWINTSNSDNIKQVLLHLDKIKKIRIFDKIDKIQCPCPDTYIDEFYRTQYKTADYKTIYERKI